MNDLGRSPQQIGSVIRRARTRRGWSQTVLGEKSNLRQATISLIESGDSRARIDSLLAVLAALDLELQIASRSQGWGPEAVS